VLFVGRSAADDRRIARPHVSKSSRQGVESCRAQHTIRFSSSGVELQA
jgi:hypothetical protein